MVALNVRAKLISVENKLGSLSMWPFRRYGPYTIEVSDYRVFMKWNQPIQQWSKKDSDAYLPALQAAVRSTVDEDVYRIISGEDMQSDPDAQKYVARVRTDLIAEYDLDDADESTWIGNYHIGMLVIGFYADQTVRYPYYYKGIQLKPMAAQQGDPADRASRGH